MRAYQNLTLLGGLLAILVLGRCSPIANSIYKGAPEKKLQESPLSQLPQFDPLQQSEVEIFDAEIVAQDNFNVSSDFNGSKSTNSIVTLSIRDTETKAIVLSNKNLTDQFLRFKESGIIDLQSIIEDHFIELPLNKITIEVGLSDAEIESKCITTLPLELHKVSGQIKLMISPKTSLSTSKEVRTHATRVLMLFTQKPSSSEK